MPQTGLSEGTGGPLRWASNDVEPKGWALVVRDSAVWAACLTFSHVTDS